MPRIFQVQSGEAKVVVYRGDNRGLELLGIPSNAYRNNDFQKIKKLVTVISSGDERAINELIQQHTDSSFGSPLVSTSLSPMLAQSFARGRGNQSREAQTIYRIEVGQNRLIGDPFNIGKSGSSGEVFIIGGIHSNEITAVKIDNSVLESELLYRQGSVAWEAIAVRHHPFYRNPPFEPVNAVNWRWVSPSSQ